MKFGEVANDINSISFKIARGWSGPENAEGERRIIHTFTDKSFEMLDYGARVRQASDFTVLDIEKQDYFDLVNYLDLNQGLPVKIEEENNGEKIFTEVNNFTSYYVYVTEFTQLGEADFSTTRERFTVSLKVVYIGEESSSRQNITDSSLIDILITVDTLRANITDGIGIVAGDRWADFESGKLKIYNGDGWVNAYNLPSDNGTLGFYGGRFFWSLFSDISYKVTTPYQMVGTDYMSGMIVKGSLDLPNKSIRISDGPNISYKNGFSFKVRNNDKFWNFINSQGVNLFGAKVTLYIYNYSGGVAYCQKIATGLNNKNNFGYMDYEFQCEPITLNSDPKFNNSQILESNERYTGINPDKAKKPPYRTFGRWDYAKIQDISISESILNIQVKGPNESDFSESFKFTAYTDRTILTGGKYKTLYVYKTGSGKELAEFTADQITDINNSQQYAISILYDSNVGTENKDKILKIVSIVDNSTFYTVTLNGGLEAGDDNAGARPSTNDYLAVVVRKNGYQFQIDENQCGGFKVVQDGEFLDGLKVYGLNEKQTGLEEIPSTGITSNAENNKIILSPETTSEKTKTDIYEDLTSPVYGYPARIDTEISKVLTSDTDFDALISGSFVARSGGHTSNNSVINTILGSGQTIYSVDNTVLNENTEAKVYTIKIDHTKDDLSFLTRTNVKLCFDFDVLSWSELSINQSGDTTIDKNRMNSIPAGFKINLRAKKYDGTYLYGDSLGVTWSYEITQKQMGIYKNPNGFYESKGSIRINNFPETGEYGELTSLPENFSRYVSSRFTDRSSRSTNDLYMRNGQLCFINNESGLAHFDSVEVTGSTVTYSNDFYTVDTGSILLWRNDNTKPYNLTVSKVVAGTPQTLSNAIEGVDFQIKPTFGGKDLFDLSPLFGEAYIWDDVEQLELFFTNEEMQDYNFTFKSDAVREKNQYYNWHFKLDSGINSIKIYGVTEKELINRPLYTSCDGEALDSDGVLDTTADYPMKMGPIFKNIIKECYGLNVNQTSIDNLALVRDIYWRKQFYDTQTAENVLRDLLLSSWSVAFFDRDDNLNIKSLNEKDYPTPSYEITDADIISIGQVKMRNADEIYQKYRLKYDFYPPGLDTSKIEKYKSQVYIDQYSTDIDAETKLNLQRSSNLFVNDNAFEKELEYIYKEEDAKKITQLIINWFVYNSWEISLDVSLSKMLNGNSIEIMDYVKFNSFFYTNDLDVYGFVTEVKPSIYEGKVSLTIYIPRPKGQLGPYGDPFNDALFMSVRDISSWTSGNGKINDAGLLSTRDVGDYTVKDGERISLRSFND